MSSIRIGRFFQEDNKYKHPSDMMVTEMFSLADFIFRQPPEDIPSRITNDMSPSDPLFLEKIKQTNAEVQKLMDAFELEVVNGDIPF